MTNRIPSPAPKKMQQPFSREDLLSNGDFAMLGIHDFAYIRKIDDPQGKTTDQIFGVFTADGTHIASFAKYAIADAAIRQNDLEPYSVH